MGIVAALTGLIGVVLGALLVRRFELDRWLRNERLQIYSEMLASVDEWRRLLDEKGPEDPEEVAAMNTVADSYAKMALTATAATHTEAVRMFTTTLTYKIGIQFSQAGLIKAGEEAREVRWDFIRCVRKELNVKPEDLPKGAAEALKRLQEADDVKEATSRSVDSSG